MSFAKTSKPWVTSIADACTASALFPPLKPTSSTATASSAKQVFDVEVIVQAPTAKDNRRSAASAVLEELQVGQPVLLVREPWTPGDESAVAVQALSGKLIGRLVSDSSDMLQVCIV